MLWPHVFSLDFITSSCILRLRWNCHLGEVWVDQDAGNNMCTTITWTNIIKRCLLIEVHLWLCFCTSLYRHMPLCMCLRTGSSLSACMSTCLCVYINLTLEDTDLSSCGSFSIVTACMCRGAFTSIGQHVSTLCTSEQSPPKSTGLNAESLKQMHPLQNSS